MSIEVQYAGEWRYSSVAVMQRRIIRRLLLRNARWRATGVGLELIGPEEIEVGEVGSWWQLPGRTLLGRTWLLVRSRSGRLRSYLGVVKTEAEAVTREREL